MSDNKELRKKLILKYPNDSATKLLDKAKALKISNRKSDFLAEVRKLRKLPEPTKVKKEKSIPIKLRVAKPKVAKPKVAKPKPSISKVLKQKKIIDFKDTKFGKIVGNLKKKHNISEKRAIIIARRILKIPRKDYEILNQIDYDILIHYGY